MQEVEHEGKKIKVLGPFEYFLKMFKIGFYFKRFRLDFILRAEGAYDDRVTALLKGDMDTYRRALDAIKQMDGGIFHQIINELYSKLGINQALFDQSMAFYASDP